MKATTMNGHSDGADLPDKVRETLRKHPNAKPSFTVKTTGEVIWDIDLPESLKPPF
jgi:hypothetical protein